MTGFNHLHQETKYSAQQGFHAAAAAGQPTPTSHTPPSSAAYHTSADFLNRYKLEQTIRQLHGIHSSDPRATFAGASFSGV